MRRSCVKTATLVICGLLAPLLALSACSGAESSDADQSPAATSAEATPGIQTPASASTPTTAGPWQAPAAPGTELRGMPRPPERSLWALSADSYDAAVEIEVEFQPYGIGPSSFGPSIVALVTAARSSQAGSRVPDLTGRNVVFILGQTKVESGGRYTGTAVTRKQEDRIVFVLQQASPASEP